MDDGIELDGGREMVGEGDEGESYLSRTVDRYRE